MSEGMEYSGSMRLHRRGFNAVRKSLSMLKYSECNTVRDLSDRAFIKFFGKGRNEFKEITHKYWIIVSEFDFEKMVGRQLKEMDNKCIGYSFEMIVNGGVVIRKEVDGSMSLSEFEDFCLEYWEQRKGEFLN